MKELRIGFESALAFWRAVRRAGAEPEAMDQGERVFGARDRGIAERVGSARALCGLEGSLDIVVPSASDRINSEHVRNRVWRGPVSERTLVRLGNGVEVFRPAAMLVQLGTVLDEIDLAEVAYELAGTYVVNPDAASKIASCGYMWVTRKNGSAEKISAASQPNVTVANPSRTPVFADLSRLFPLRSAPPTPAAIVRIEQNENSRSTVSGSFIRKPTGRHTSIAVPMKAVRTETR